jgi:hypothetical protein
MKALSLILIGLCFSLFNLNAVAPQSRHSSMTEVTEYITPQ